MTSLTLTTNAEREGPVITSKTVVKEHIAWKENNLVKEIEEWTNILSNLKWCNIIILSFYHLVALYSLLFFDFTINIRTILWVNFNYLFGAMGITAGLHRYWTHRSYKAKLPLRIILLICHLSAGQGTVYNWVRDHRVHHKYTETNADPHNSNRGLFFSHIGWLLIKKHPEVIKKGRQIDMSDIKADLIAMFCDKYFPILAVIFSIVIPIIVPVYGWHETWSTSIKIYFIYRVLGEHCVWSVNSFAHAWGTKPYNKNIKPTNNKIVSFFAFGEGWHNYHHVFPWDYKTSEFGDYKLNFTTMFIDFFAKIGWAYDLQQPSKELVKAIVMKKGDENHHKWDSVPHPDEKEKNAFVLPHTLLN